MYTQNSLRTSPARAILGHGTGATPPHGPMPPSADRLKFNTRTPTGINPNKVTDNNIERADRCHTDGLDNYPRRIDGVAHKPQCQLRRKITSKSRTRTQTSNATSITDKQPQLVDQPIRHRIHIVALSYTNRKGNGTLRLNKRWQLFYPAVDTALHAQAAVAILTSTQLAETVVQWRPISEREWHS